MARSREVYRIWGVALALAVGLGILWLAWPGADGRGRSDGSARALEADAPAAPAVLDAHTDRAPALGEQEPGLRTELAAEAPDAALAPPEPEAARWVEVLEAWTRAPLADVEVGYRAWEGHWNALAFERLMLRADTGKTRTDARGRARIPWPAHETVFVMAHDEAHCGAAAIAPPQGPDAIAVLELALDWGVEVEVVEADGRPAQDVPLQLVTRGVRDVGVLDARTAADGRAAFAHVGMVFAQEKPRSMTVEVALALREPLAAALAPERPALPIRLRLPATGSVALHVLERDGKPVRDETAVQLGLVWPGEPRQLSPFAPERPTQRVQTVAGGAAFAHVPLGAELEVSVQAEREALFYLPGPARVGEAVEHTVRLALGHVRVVLRVVDESGTALANEALRWSLRAEELAEGEGTPVGTNADGTLELELCEPHPADERRVLKLRSPHDLAAELDLSRELGPAPVELGDVVLHALPSLASGRVVSASGAAPPGTVVHVQEAMEDRSWDSVLERRVECDALGNFHYRGGHPRWLRLQARTGEARSDARVVPAGTDGIELQLHPLGVLAGSVLGDAGTPRDLYKARLIPAPEVARRAMGRIRDVTPEPNGDFHWAGLMPGSYTLVAGAPELVRVEGLLVPEGGACEDPRLQGIDLRGRLFPLRLTLVASEPLTLAEGTLEAGRTGSSERRSGYRVVGNPAELWLPFERVNGTLSIEGFRDVELHDVSGSCEVALRPDLRVRLVLPPGIPLPTEPYSLKASLRHGDGSNGDDIDWGASAFDEGRESLSCVGRPGLHPVAWIFERGTRFGASAISFTLEPTQIVEVADVDGEQRVELQVDPEALAQAIARAMKDMDGD